MNKSGNRWGKCLPLIPLLLLAACGKEPAATGGNDSAALLPAGPASGLRVNGEAVPQPLLEAYARMRGWNLTDPNQLSQVREKTAELVAMAQAARDAGLLDDDQLQGDLALSRLNAIAGRYVEQTTAAAASEEALRAEYERERSQLGQYEYQVAHILVDDQAKAAELSARIAAEGFAAVLADVQGQPGVRDARDLGWVKRTQLPESLRPVVDALGDSGVASEPVQSEFGWHLVELEARRDFAPAPFEQVRDGIAASLSRKQALELTRQVVQQAKIEND